MMSIKRGKDVTPGDVTPGDVTPGDVTPGDVTPSVGWILEKAENENWNDVTSKTSKERSCHKINLDSMWKQCCLIDVNSTFVNVDTKSIKLIN